MLSNKAYKSALLSNNFEMLRSVVIEVRQHLRCANVFLNFIHPVRSVESIKINLDKKWIRLQDATGILVTAWNVERYFTILTETLSNLLVDEEFVSFRLNVLDLKLLDEQHGKSSSKFNFLLQQNQEVAFHCRQCESVVTVSRCYDKVREFPSGAIDVGEFFCHHGPSFSDVLLPRLQDAFYGFQQVIVNVENVSNFTHIKESHVYCKRCKRYLGETMFDGKSVKLWSDSVTMKRTEDLQPVDVFGCERHQTPVLLMLKVIKESSLPSTEPLLRNMHFVKVILQTTLPNRERQYLLVHILEKQLPVLKNRAAANGESGLEDLELFSAFKILYRLIDSERRRDDDTESDTKYPTLFSYWQQDINILKMNISPFLFQQLIDILEENSLLLPEVYRNNKDYFTLSYIFQ